MARTMKFEKGKGEVEEVTFLTPEDLEAVRAEIRELKEARSRERAREEPRAPSSPTYECPACGVFVKDLFTHLKSDPERHGLVKEVEVKKPLKERLKDHDIFDCPECRAVVNEHLKAKGLKIVPLTERDLEREVEDLFGE